MPVLASSGGSAGVAAVRMAVPRHCERSRGRQRVWEEDPMAESKSSQAFPVHGGQILDKVKELIHEGNVRRIVIKRGDRTVLELPLTVGTVGALLAPWLAAVGALAAFVTDCTIEVERTEEPESAHTQGLDVTPPP